MASILPATSQPEYTSNAAYLYSKSEEQLLEIICIFNFNIIFLKNQFRSSISQDNLKIYGDSSCCKWGDTFWLGIQLTAKEGSVEQHYAEIFIAWHYCLSFCAVLLLYPLTFPDIASCSFHSFFFFPFPIFSFLSSHFYFFFPLGSHRRPEGSWSWIWLS